MELFILLSDALRNILIDGYGSLNYLRLLCICVTHRLHRVDRFVEKLRHIPHTLKYIFKIRILRAKLGRVLFHLRCDLRHVILYPLDHGLHHFKRFLCAVCKGAHLGCNHRKPFSCLARSRSLNGCIQRQQICGGGNVADKL